MASLETSARMESARQQIANCLKEGLVLTPNDFRAILQQHSLSPLSASQFTCEISTGLFKAITGVQISSKVIRPSELDRRYGNYKLYFDASRPPTESQIQEIRAELILQISSESICK